MSATLICGKERLEFTDHEWELLKKFIIRDQIEFWETIAAEVDGGLLPIELASPNLNLIDRNVLFSLKTKLSKVIY